MNYLLYPIVFLTGSCLTLAFAPFGIWPLAIICPTLLLIFWQNIPPKQAFFRGIIFGLGFLGTGLSWVYVSLHDYGNANPGIAAMMTFVLILLLTSYIGIAGYVLNKYFYKNTYIRYFIAFPSLWVLSEWARGWIFTGFPWLFLGYSQLNTPLAGWAPILGVFGLSWIIALTAAFLAWSLKGCYFPRFSTTTAATKIALNPYLLIFILSLWLLGFIFNQISWTTPDDKGIQVSLIQGNNLPALKWLPEEAEKNLNLYLHLTKQHSNSALIVWPESAITTLLSVPQMPKYLLEIDQTAKAHHNTLISGIPLQIESHYYNGMIALGDGVGTYQKRHLVPFGEYIPLRFLWSWLESYIQMPMSDFTPGQRYQPLLMAGNIPIAAFICYEIAYPDEVLDSLPEGKLLLVISDDSWFGKSIAPSQHLEIAQMRALESGRELLMSTNDGLTAIIDAHGKIVTSIPPFEVGVLTAHVQPMTGSTPWVWIGVYPILSGMLLLLVGGWYLQRRSPHDKRT